MNGQLASLARLYGIQTSYWNSWHGRQVEAEPESVLSVLATLGATVRKMADVPKELRTRRQELRSKGPEPVIVAWDGKIPQDPGVPHGAKVHFVTESGEEIRKPRANGRLPLGYHTRIVQSGRTLTETLVIAAPRQAFFPFDQRVWGTFSPVYALRSARKRGAGDLTDLETFADWTLSQGGRLVATLPLLATFLNDGNGPFDASPYAPASRLFWNEFYADPRRAPEFDALGPERNAFDPELPEPRHVDYRGVMKKRRAALEAMADAFFERATPERRAAFETFCWVNSDLDDYARFRAVTDRQGTGWKVWPTRLQDGVIERNDYDGRTWHYHRYTQWIVQEQLRRITRRINDAGGALYLDMPLGIHADGYDTWRYRDLFVKGVAGGAPPDPLFTSGQNWGFPPLHPEITRRKHHTYTIACIRNHLKYGRLLRIDHVMGLHRFYWIPDGADGSQGLYVEYPADELYAILSLESHRAGAGIVGENLGTVPPEVNTALQQHNIRRLYVAQYEIRDAGLTPPPADTVASLNTHDTPPFRGFLEGRDIADHRDLGFIDAKGERTARRRRRKEIQALTAGLHNQGLLPKKTADDDALRDASIRFLSASAAAVTLINVEDLWLEADPQNVPATSFERPNWKRRLRRSLKQIQSDRPTAALLKDVDRTVAESAQSTAKKTQRRKEHAAVD